MEKPGSRSEQLPLTFGIEVEFLLGVKQHESESFRWLCPMYSAKTDSPENPVAGSHSMKVTPCSCRFDDCQAPSIGHWQALKVFSRAGGEVRLVKKEENDDFDRFCHWHVTTESSLVFPEDSDQMATFSDGVLIDQEPLEWDFTGLELISPALAVPAIEGNSFRPRGLEDVRKYAEIMSRDRHPKAPYNMFAHPECSGVHVHIGVQPQPSGQIDLPLNVLRHLAFLSVFFEDAITLLHHPQRRTYPDSKCRHHCTPNRHVLMSKHSKDRVHTCRLGEPFSPEEAFMKIFYCGIDDEPKARRELADRMGSRKNVETEGSREWDDIKRTLYVNFENIANAKKPSDKRTVEFRQHHGTKNPVDLEHWVVFVTALVRAAERLSKETTDKINVPPALASKIYTAYPGDIVKRSQALAEATKYTHLLRQQRRSLKQLFDVLQLPVDIRRYWWLRARGFQNELARNWPEQSQSICDEDCGYPTIRDCEGWDDGGLDYPPWEVIADPVETVAEGAKGESKVDEESEHVHIDDAADDSEPMELDQHADESEPMDIDSIHDGSEPMDIDSDSDLDDCELMDVDHGSPEPEDIIPRTPDISPLSLPPAVCSTAPGKSNLRKEVLSHVCVVDQDEDSRGKKRRLE